MASPHEEIVLPERPETSSLARPRPDDLLWPGILFLLVLINLLPSLIHQRLPFEIRTSEFIAQGYAYHVFFKRALAAGLFPLWSSNILCGLPLYAFSHFGMFYPFNFRWLPVPLSFQVYLLFHHYLFISGCYLLFRGLRISRTASGLAGLLALCLSLPVPGWGPVMAEFALTPWLFLSALRAAQRPALRRVLFLALVLALMVFAGHVEVMVYSLASLLLMLIFFHLLRIVRISEGGGFCLALAGAGALLVSLPQLLPLQEYVAQSIRNRGVTAAFFLWEKNAFFNPWVMLAVTLSPVPLPEAPQMGSVLFWTALATALLHPKSRNSAWGLLAISGLFLAYALSGEFTFQIVSRLPFLNQLVRVFAFSYAAGVMFLMVLAWGLERMLEQNAGRFSSAAGAVLAGGGALAALISAAIFGAAPSRIFFAGAFSLLFLIRLTGRSAASRKTLLLIIAFSLFQTMFLFHQWNPGRKGSLALLKQLNPQTEILGKEGRYANLSRDGVFDLSQSYHLGLLHDTRELWSIITVAPRRLMELWSGLEPELVGFQNGKLDRYRVYPDSFTGRYLNERTRPFLNFLGLRWVYSRGQPFALAETIPPANPPVSIPSSSSAAPFRVAAGTDILLFENSAAFPLQFIVHQAVVVSETEAKRFVLSGGQENLREKIAIPRPADFPLFPPHGEASADEIVPLRREPGRELFQLSCSSPGFFFQTENHYPGWRAFLDDHEVQLLRADYAFRAVAVPPGRHRLSLLFVPLSFRIGLWAALATFAAVPAVILRRRLVHCAEPRP